MKQVESSIKIKMEKGAWFLILFQRKFSFLLFKEIYLLQVDMSPIADTTLTIEATKETYLRIQAQFT